MNVMEVTVNIAGEADLRMFRRVLNRVGVPPIRVAHSFTRGKATAVLPADVPDEVLDRLAKVLEASGLGHSVYMVREVQDADVRGCFAKGLVSQAMKSLGRATALLALAAVVSRKGVDSWD